MQIIGDDYCIEPRVGIRPWRAFKIGDAGRYARDGCKLMQGARIAIDRLDPKAQSRQIARVTPAAAGDIEHPAAGANQRRKAAHPGGWRVKIAVPLRITHAGWTARRR